MKNAFFFFLLLSSVATAIPNRIVITGGPGVGKTTIINELKRRGFQVLDESAADVISNELNNGNSEYWRDPEFCNNILRLQISRETETENLRGQLFQDRSVIDTYAFVNHAPALTPPSTEVNQTINGLRPNERYFRFVFFVQDLGESFTHEGRREDLQESRRIDQALRVEFTQRGYQIVDIPPASPSERVDQILRVLCNEIRNQSPVRDVSANSKCQT
ncbi:MAG: AAA family ATPase [Myxococcaceae bacterium]